MKIIRKVELKPGSYEEELPGISDQRTERQHH